MSIINEALRKARLREEKSGRSPEGDTDSPPLPPKRKKEPPGWRFYLGPLLLLIVFIGGAFYGAVWIYQNATGVSPAAGASADPEAAAIPESIDPLETLPTVKRSPTDMVAPVLEAVTERVQETQRISAADPPAEPETPTEEASETLLKLARTLRIEGVSLIPGNHRVLINGSFYGEGDALREESSITVREIRERYILLEYQNGAEHRLSY